MEEIKYTKPSRENGLWEVDATEDGLEVYKSRDNGSHRPICKMEDPDIGDAESWGDCAGNFALVAAAPEMYQIIQQTEQLLIFMLKRPSTTQGEKAEYQYLLSRVLDVNRNISRIVEHLRIEANVDDEEGESPRKEPKMNEADKERIKEIKRKVALKGLGHSWERCDSDAKFLLAKITELQAENKRLRLGLEYIAKNDCANIETLHRFRQIAKAALRTEGEGRA